MDSLRAALRYLNHGLAPIPIWPDGLKNPHLTTTAPYTKTLPTPGDVRRWWSRWPRANIGLITGYWLNYVALDFDDRASYELWQQDNLTLSCQTWTVATARGYHVWFQLSEDPGPSRSFVKSGQEVLLRAKGGYCIAPPSVHHTGARYRTVHKVPVLEIGAVSDVLPGWELKTPKTDRKRSQRMSGSPNLEFSTNVRIENLIPIPQDSRPQGQHGAYQVYCPFHEDGRPSAWLNVEQQRFGCNACWPGRWWDVVNVYAKMHDISNSEAYKKLKATPKGSPTHRTVKG